MGISDTPTDRELDQAFGPADAKAKVEELNQKLEDLAKEMELAESFDQDTRDIVAEAFGVKAHRLEILEQAKKKAMRATLPEGTDVDLEEGIPSDVAVVLN